MLSVIQELNLDPRVKKVGKYAGIGAGLGALGYGAYNALSGEGGDNVSKYSTRPESFDPTKYTQSQAHRIAREEGHHFYTHGDRKMNSQNVGEPLIPSSQYGKDLENKSINRSNLKNYATAGLAGAVAGGSYGAYNQRNRKK